MVVKQLDAIDALWREYDKECEEIAAQCAAEGYPSYGAVYEFRCEAAYWRYKEQEYIIIEEGV
jgi:hypothetical protein